MSTYFRHSDDFVLPSQKDVSAQHRQLAIPLAGSDPPFYISNSPPALLWKTVQWGRMELSAKCQIKMNSINTTEPATWIKHSPFRITIAGFNCSVAVFCCVASCSRTTARQVCSTKQQGLQHCQGQHLVCIASHCTQMTHHITTATIWWDLQHL